jgi:hypothetical protein
MTLVKDTVVLRGISTPEYELITGYSQFRVYEPYASIAVLLGKSGEFSATSALQVGFNQRPDTLDYLKPEDIIQAKLFLYLNDYIFGEQDMPQLSFDAKRINRFWSPRIVSDPERKDIFTTWDSLYISPANYFGDNIGNFTGTIQITDSTENKIDLDIDPQYMIDLFQIEGTDTNDDGNDDIFENTIDWGIVLDPQDQSNAIHQLNFISVGDDLDLIDSDLRTPYYEVIYNSKEGTVDTLRMYVEAAAEFAKSPLPPSDRMILQAGENLRTSISFDISDIPTLAGIVKAEMEIFTDEDNTYYGSFGQDTIISLSLLQDLDGFNDFISDSTSFLFNESYTYYGFRNDSTSSYVFPSIGSSLELWLRTEYYPSLILSTNIRSILFDVNDNEIFQMDRISFYGPDAEDPDKRPKLTVIYSYLPENE